MIINMIYLAEACVLLGLDEAGGLRPPPRPLRHQLDGRGDALPPFGRAALQLHDARARGVRLAPPLWLNIKIHHAEFVDAITEFTRSQLYRWADHDDWSKIRIVRCGVDAAYLDVPPTPVPDVPRLVNVGRMVEQKGQLLLIEAVSRLAREGIDCELVIVGDGPMRDDAERLIERLGLVGKVRLAGYMSGKDVRDELQAARALVLPSFAEGLPVVILESLALGRPVISTYIAGIPELVEPGRAAGWSRPARSTPWSTPCGRS